MPSVSIIPSEFTSAVLLSSSSHKLSHFVYSVLASSEAVVFAWNWPNLDCIVECEPYGLQFRVMKSILPGLYGLAARAMTSRVITLKPVDVKINSDVKHVKDLIMNRLIKKLRTSNTAALCAPH